MYDIRNGTYPTFLRISQLAKSEDKLWLATATPGFNGTNYGKNEFPVVARNDGTTFIKGWDIAQNSNPDGIIEGTWNEFYEGPSIEPPTSYGTYYLQLTGQLSMIWRSPTHTPRRNYIWGPACSIAIKFIPIRWQ